MCWKKSSPAFRSGVWVNRRKSPRSLPGLHRTKVAMPPVPTFRSTGVYIWVELFVRPALLDSPALFYHDMACSMAGSKLEVQMTNTKKAVTRLIKKYPNRRLYDTQTSSYITLSDVKQLVLAAEEFAVVDARNGDDLTRSILLQIIRYYGHAMQGMMGSYLEKNIQAFIDIQNRLAENSKGFYEGQPFSPEMWTQFMNMQGPIMQGMMSNYIEQSKGLFIQMQEQMQNQTKNMFGTFPFAPPP